MVPDRGAITKEILFWQDVMPRRVTGVTSRTVVRTRADRQIIPIDKAVGETEFRNISNNRRRLLEIFCLVTWLRS